MQQSVYLTTNANTPAILTGATALAANPKRIAWSIQNVGTNALFINFFGTFLGAFGKFYFTNLFNSLLVGSRPFYLTKAYL